MSLLLASFLCIISGYAAAHLSGIGLGMGQYFPPGPWRWLLWGTGVASGVAVLLTAIDSSLGRRRALHVVHYDGSRSESASATLEEVRQCVQAALHQKQPDIARVLDEALRGALLLGASDMHVTPARDEARVTYRVDGSLIDAFRLKAAFSRRLVLRAKVMAQLETYEMRPQDGAFTRQLGGFQVEARVSVLPANHGERLVLRLVRGSDAVQELADLGFAPRVERQLREILQKTEGVFYVSGPVGSGKTTTLYSSLQEIHDRRGETLSLVSLEDPIEHQLGFVTQTQINPKTGFGFAQALRTVLRQDPGALMIGEVRDQETAEIVLQAGLTGHLILTTLHVQSAASTFPRLIDMGLSPVLVADSCAGALAQRLVRRLCPHCRSQVRPSDEQVERLQRMGASRLEPRYFLAAGCSRCEGKGYSGRKVVAEILVMTEALRQAVTAGASTAEVHELALRAGMIPLVESALALAERGETSLDEVLRVIS